MKLTRSQPSQADYILLKTLILALTRYLIVKDLIPFRSRKAVTKQPPPTLSTGFLPLLKKDWAKKSLHFREIQKRNEGKIIRANITQMSMSF